MSAIDLNLTTATALGVARERSGAGALLTGLALVVVLGGVALLAPAPDPAANAVLTDWHGNSASLTAPQGAR
ncbi:hypothetical protein N4R57_10075 [Rhodobacteraceae bacterium D3-12]|nr:hypothetical protein N4R57_10075 [Rhodobacteraceae bacterium D3-12]